MPGDLMPARYAWARVLECAWLGLRVCHRLSGPARAGSGRLGGTALPLSAAPAGHVALTFDDGPDSRWTPAALDLLGAHRVTATFFLIGARVREQPGLARRIAEAGHVVGNHSMHHPQPFAALSRPRLEQEISGAQHQIEDALGMSPRLFRAPGGGWSPAVLRALATRGLAAADWSRNPSDWKCPGTARLTRRLAASRPSDVVLCHDGGGDRSQTIAALEVVIPVLKQRGLTFVTLAPAQHS